MRLLAVSKTRPQDLKSAIGEFELSSYPPSNFTPNGDFIMHNDKSKLFKFLNELQKTHDNNQLPTNELPVEYSLILIDGMRLVNEINKTGTAQDFSNEFIKRLGRLTETYSEVC